MSNKAADVLAALACPLESQRGDDVARRTARAARARRRGISTGHAACESSKPDESFSPPAGNRIPARAPPATAIVSPRSSATRSSRRGRRCVPLTTTAPWVLDLRGVTLPDVTLSILEEGRPLASRRSSLLFAHFGLDRPGGAWMSAGSCRAILGRERSSSRSICCPSETNRSLLDWLREESTASGKKQVAAVVGQLLPRRLAEIVLEQSGVAVERKAAELSKADRGRLVRTLKHLAVPADRHAGIQESGSHRGRRFARRSRFAHDAEQARAEPVFRRRNARSRRPDRRLQFSSRLEHRLAGRRAACEARTRPASRQNACHHVAGHVGQAEVAALVAVGQPGVVDAEQAQHRGVEIVGVNAIVSRRCSRIRRSRRG